MSPGFRLRPSLSGGHARGPRFRPPHVSPGFRLRPSLSDARRHGRPAARDGVAGVQTPAFVERGCGREAHPRPLGVAGVQTPAFVERFAGCSWSARSWPVSPGFRLRPSLSGSNTYRRNPHTHTVSPGFRLRPSLSDAAAPGELSAPAGVAGVQTPAFVERGPGARSAAETARVSPGFRLRPSLSAPSSSTRRIGRAPVSPGFRLRPSLSDLERDCRVRVTRGCRRGSDSGLR